MAGWMYNKNVAHWNHWTVECQQQIYPRAMDWQKAEVFLSWMAFVSYLLVLQNVYPEPFNPPTSQRVFTTPYTRCTDSQSNHWSGIQVARACCQDTCATAARMSLKVGIADSMHGNNGEHFTKRVAASDKRKMEKYILLNLTTWRWFSAHFTWKPPLEKYISCENPTY